MQWKGKMKKMENNIVKCYQKLFIFKMHQGFETTKKKEKFQSRPSSINQSTHRRPCWRFLKRPKDFLSLVRNLNTNKNHQSLVYRDLSTTRISIRVIYQIWICPNGAENCRGDFHRKRNRCVLKNQNWIFRRKIWEPENIQQDEEEEEEEKDGR